MRHNITFTSAFKPTYVFFGCLLHMACTPAALYAPQLSPRSHGGPPLYATPISPVWQAAATAPRPFGCHPRDRDILCHGGAPDAFCDHLMSLASAQQDETLP